MSGSPYNPFYDALKEQRKSQYQTRGNKGLLAHLAVESADLPLQNAERSADILSEADFMLKKLSRLLLALAALGLAWSGVSHLLAVLGFSAFLESFFWGVHLTAAFLGFSIFWLAQLLLLHGGFRRWNALPPWPGTVLPIIIYLYLIALFFWFKKAYPNEAEGAEAMEVASLVFSAGWTALYAFVLNRAWAAERFLNQRPEQPTEQ